MRRIGSFSWLLLCLLTLCGCEGQSNLVLDAGFGDASSIDSPLCFPDEELGVRGSCIPVSLQDSGLGIVADAKDDPALTAACVASCRVSVQVMCQRSRSEEACVRVCLDQGARCLASAILLFQCIGALTPSDLLCHPTFQTPILREGRCDAESMDYGSCQLKAVMDAQATPSP